MIWTRLDANLLMRKIDILFRNQTSMDSCAFLTKLISFEDNLEYSFLWQTIIFLFFISLHDICLSFLYSSGFIEVKKINKYVCHLVSIMHCQGKEKISLSWKFNIFAILTGFFSWSYLENKTDVFSFLISIWK